MPKKQSTAEKKARAAARAGAKYTEELRAHSAGPGRTVAVEELGDVVDIDDVYNALHAREGEHGTASAALGEAECWSYVSVQDEWQKHLADELQAHGLALSGMVWRAASESVTVPGTVTDAEAARAWQQIVDGFEDWMDGIVDAVRRGKPLISGRVRPATAPGGDWVDPVGPLRPGGARLFEGEDLDPMTEHDDVTDVVFGQTENGDTGALARGETFAWPLIVAEHRDVARRLLGAHGIEWDPETGEVLCPAGKTTERVTGLWELIRSEADERVLDIVDEVRDGRPADPDSERAAGHEWVFPL